MPKASITLASGVVVQLEGTSEEIKDLLKSYGEPANKPVLASRAKPQQSRGRSHTPSTDGLPDFTAITNLVRNCTEAENIERNILDRVSAVNRVLLPLYIVHEHIENALGLTTGDISKITRDLGVPVSTPNASHALTGTAAKYVIGDRVRRKGEPVRYKLGRRGVQYLREVISANENKG